MIVLPKFKDLYVAKKIAACAGQVSGHFMIEAIRPDGRKRLLVPWQRNLLLDSGLDNLGTTNDWMKSCYVGEGSTPPAIGQVALTTYVAGTSTAQANSAAGQGTILPYYGWYRRTYRFAQGVAEGNLTEVGVGPTSGNLSTRSLILDGSQNPTTITVLSDEILDVTWEFRQYPSDQDTLATVVLDGETFDVTSRAVNAVDGSDWYVRIPSISAYYYSGEVNNHPIVAWNEYLAWDTTTSDEANLAYVNGSYKRGVTLGCNVDNGNFGGDGIKSFRCPHSRGGFQYGFVSQLDGGGIPKDNTKTLEISFEISWDRRP